jgi:restriction endonuclease S subunit
LFSVTIGRRVLNNEVDPRNNIPVYSANVYEPFGMIDRLLIEDFTKDSIIWGIDGDWMVNIIPANHPFYPTDHCGVLRLLKNDIIHPKYMAHLLGEKGKNERFSRTNRASIERIKGLSVKVISLQEQIEVIKRVEQYEAQISKAKAVMAGYSERKKQILDKWLK